VLTNDVTVAGAVDVHLWWETTGTDADVAAVVTAVETIVTGEMLVTGEALVTESPAAET
jgi:hypothetical protein